MLDSRRSRGPCRQAPEPGEQRPHRPVRRPCASAAATFLMSEDERPDNPTSYDATAFSADPSAMLATPSGPVGSRAVAANGHRAQAAAAAASPAAPAARRPTPPPPGYTREPPIEPLAPQQAHAAEEAAPARDLRRRSCCSGSCRSRSGCSWPSRRTCRAREQLRVQQRRFELGAPRRPRQPDRDPQPAAPRPAQARPGSAARHQRRHLRRGQALLPQPRHRHPRHRTRAPGGRAPRRRRAGRLHDRAAVRQERAAGPGAPHDLREAARGRARLPPLPSVEEGQDHHRVPQHDLLRERRLRHRGGGADVLRPHARLSRVRCAR